MPSSKKSRKSGGSKKARGKTKFSGVEEMGPYFMDKGRYYVGDLSGVLTNDEVKEFSGKIGQFTLTGGREIVNFKLPYGDGIYPDSKGRNHIVDSGTVGITLAEGLKKTMYGHIFDHDEKFACASIYRVHPDKDIVGFISIGDEVGIYTENQLGGITALFKESGSGGRIKFNTPGVEIDYIRPLASFKDIHSWTMDAVTEEMHSALNFNNLQLRQAVDNNLKGITYDAEAYAQSKEGLAAAFPHRRVALWWMGQS
jgi:hypothetical protein